MKFLDALLRHPEPKLSVANRGIDLAVFGHEVTSQKMLGNISVLSKFQRQRISLVSLICQNFEKIDGNPLSIILIETFNELIK